MDELRKREFIGFITKEYESYVSAGNDEVAFMLLGLREEFERLF